MAMGMVVWMENGGVECGSGSGGDRVGIGWGVVWWEGWGLYGGIKSGAGVGVG